MRRQVLLLLFLFVSIIGNAQIRRNVDGVVLGVSTKQDVIRHLRSRNMPYELIEDGSVIRSFKDNNFAGVSWFIIFYRFYNNKVYRITYTKHANGYDVPNSLIDTEFSLLQRNLLSKYQRYNTRNAPPLYQYTTSFNDGKTGLQVGKGYYEGTYLLSLIYVDIYLEGKSAQHGYDDL